MSDTIAIFGVGGMGTAVLDLVIEQLAKDDSAESKLRTIAVNRPQASLDTSRAETAMFLDAPDLEGDGNVDSEKWNEVLNAHQDQVRHVVDGMEKVIVIAGLGGLTGSTVAPMVARIAKQQGAEVEALVTTPMIFEGPSRSKKADQALEEINSHADKVTTVTGNKLMAMADSNVALDQAFEQIDNKLAAKVVELIS